MTNNTMTEIDIDPIEMIEHLKSGWGEWSVYYLMDGGETWQLGSIQGDGHLWAYETLVDENGNPVPQP